MPYIPFFSVLACGMCIDTHFTGVPVKPFTEYRKSLKEHRDRYQQIDGEVTSETAPGTTSEVAHP